MNRFGAAWRQASVQPLERHSRVTEPGLETTVLNEAHQALGARMVAFAGYSMPIQYRDGILAEHRWTRESAGLFDVSHMGPAFLEVTARTGDPEANHAAIAKVIEPLISGDIAGLPLGRLRYSLMLNRDGGILDDLMIGRPSVSREQGRLYLVVNSGTKEADFAAIAAHAGDRARLTRADDRALIALQGPKAGEVLADIVPESAALKFMDFARAEFAGHRLIVSRSGYTGEDGFEILSPAMIAGRLWDQLLADERVRPVGLGARDSLRLEAGLPLYGHDMDETVSPFEADLGFAVSPRRLKAVSLRGSARLAAEKAGALARRRVGLRVLEGAPAREGAAILDRDGTPVGQVTSGGFSPSLSAPIAMGFVPPALAADGEELQVVVRGAHRPARVAPLPFVPHRYRR